MQGPAECMINASVCTCALPAVTSQSETPTGLRPSSLCVCVCVRAYLDDHAHNRQREDSSRMGRRPAVYVITSCQSNTQTTAI